MNRWVHLALCLLFLQFATGIALPEAQARFSCPDLVEGAKNWISRRTPQPSSQAKPQVDRMVDSIGEWQGSVELGFKIHKVIGRRIVSIMTPDKGEVNVFLFNMNLAPGADRSARRFYAQMGTEKNGRNPRVIFHSIDDRDGLQQMNEKYYQAVWQTYRKKGVVKTDEVKDFDGTEHELDSRRKILLTFRSKKGRILSVMRGYDGSTYPYFYFGMDTPPTPQANPPEIDPDARLPIERRYPELNLREDTNYIFEMGRLAKAENVEGDALAWQFRNFARYLSDKFGHEMAPGFTRGWVNIEITSQHLRRYMSDPGVDPDFDRSLGFRLFAMKRGNSKMTRVPPGTRYEDLGVDPKNTEDKFVLRMNIIEFLMNFERPL